jgi:hypothetical protein
LRLVHFERFHNFSALSGIVKGGIFLEEKCHWTALVSA